MNSFESLKLILAGGAIDKQVYTPLQKVVMGNKPKAVQLLLEHGADMTILNSFGKTPLDAAL